jgi:hypothetical protein
MTAGVCTLPSMGNRCDSRTIARCVGDGETLWIYNGFMARAILGARIVIADVYVNG